MPMYSLHCERVRMYAVWHIQETEQALREQLMHAEVISPAVTHPQKRLEFIASRLLTQKLVAELGGPYLGLTKDEFGKPYLINSTVHISQSHSYPYVAVILDTEKNTGIDIEQRKKNLLRVAPRVFSKKEMNGQQNNLSYLCVLWCAKEALIKVHGKKNLILKEDLVIDPFILQTAGSLTGCIKKNNRENFYTLQYNTESDFVMVFIS